MNQKKKRPCTNILIFLIEEIEIFVQFVEFRAIMMWLM